MSDTDDNPPQERAEVVAARPVVNDTLKRTLEADGNADAADYLDHLVRLDTLGTAEQNIDGKLFKRVRFGINQRLTEYSSRFNAQSGDPLSWFASGLMEGLSDAASKEDCLKAASEMARPPKDAVLDLAEYDEFNGEPVFIARWSHWVQGILVEPDYIHVMVNGGTRQVFGLRMHWHTPSPKAGER